MYAAISATGLKGENSLIQPSGISRNEKIIISSTIVDGPC